jgi:hypothetical protein
MTATKAAKAAMTTKPKPKAKRNPVVEGFIEALQKHERTHRRH